MNTAMNLHSAFRAYGHDRTCCWLAPTANDHGAADELTSIGRCREYVARLRNAGKDVALFEYAGAKHWFDNADLANRQTPTGCLELQQLHIPGTG